MKITYVMVTSLDGRSTKGTSTGTSPWASSEDQTIFQGLIASHECIVMGSNTYKSIRDFVRPRADKPRTVLTHNPEQFAEDASKEGLIFSSETPTELANRLEQEGINKVLLVSGAQLSAAFFDAGLVDEVFISIEPLLFGSGLPLVGELRKDITLQLLSHKQLNDQGTLLLHYSVTNANQGN